MKYRRTHLNSEVVIWEKILFVEETHDKKKEEAKPKISGEKNVSSISIILKDKIQYYNEVVQNSRKLLRHQTLDRKLRN